MTFHIILDTLLIIDFLKNIFVAWDVFFSLGFRYFFKEHFSSSRLNFPLVIFNFSFTFGAFWNYKYLKEFRIFRRKLSPKFVPCGKLLFLVSFSFSGRFIFSIIWDLLMIIELFEENFCRRGWQFCFQFFVIFTKSSTFFLWKLFFLVLFCRRFIFYIISIF